MRSNHVPDHNLDLLIMAIVAGQPRHGYSIVEELKRRSQGIFSVPEGTLYPALYRLENRGWLQSTVKVVAGRQRRLYELTRVGKRSLTEQQDLWKKFNQGIKLVLTNSHAKHY